MEKGLTQKKASMWFATFYRDQNETFRWRMYTWLLLRVRPEVTVTFIALSTWIVVHPNSMLYDLVIYLANLLNLAHDMRLFFSKEHTLLFSLSFFLLWLYGERFSFKFQYIIDLYLAAPYFAVSNGQTPTTVTKWF